MSAVFCLQTVTGINGGSTVAAGFGHGTVLGAAEKVIEAAVILPSLMSDYITVDG
ncbi:MAG: hypothetical protein LBS31_02490 [Candidatus Adiutrix sp.]|nr:hypothetical protein [Candidatus Adiutrix sp.]